MAAPANFQRDQATRVLLVLLQQLPDSWDVRTLCSLMRVSTASRIAVLTAGVSCTVDSGILYTADPSTGNPQLSSAKIVDFCAWLPGHAGLVSVMHLDGISWHPFDQLLSLALQLCTPQAAAAAGGTVTATGLLQPVQQLRITQLRVSFMPSPKAVKALASFSTLTEVMILSMSPEDPSLATCCSFSKLAGLQALHLQQSNRSSMFPAHLGSALSGLHNLRKLQCLGGLHSCTLRQLPAQLQRLDVAVSQGTPTSAAVDVDISHLTQLTDIRLLVAGRCSDVMLLPEAVTDMALTLHTAGRVRPQLALPSARTFRYYDAYMDEFRPQLSAMPQLQELELNCMFARVVLPEMSWALSLASASVTQLTSLHIHRVDVSSSSQAISGLPLPQDVPLRLAASLGELPSLRDLHVLGFKLQPADVLKWPAPPGLLSLALQRCPTLGDTAAAALACKLTGLTNLELSSCGLQSPVLWPAFAACTGLRTLNLAGNQLSIDSDTLMLLTTLTSLNLLDLQGVESGGVDEGITMRFWSAMPQLVSMAGM